MLRKTITEAIREKRDSGGLRVSSNFRKRRYYSIQSEKTHFQILFYEVRLLATIEHATTK